MPYFTKSVIVTRWLLGLIVLLSGAARGQATFTDASLKHTPGLPPPPEAAALGKFGQTPVSLHTGIPQISIPIYTITIPDVNVPISLDYHAGGIRAGELASNVGLGWALQAGGVISSTTYGLPDFAARGYVVGGSNNLIPTNRMLRPLLRPDPLPGFYFRRHSTPDYDFAMRVTGSPTGGSDHPYSYSYDTQPDVFYYNLAGRSGGFFHTQNGEAHPMPYAPLAIKRLPGNPSPWQRGSGYTIVDEKGTQYLFDQIETSATSITKHGAPSNPTDETTSRSLVFHLSQIKTIKGDIIRFSYDTLTYKYQNITSRTRFRKLPQNYCTARSESYTESFSIVKSLVIKEITSSVGHRVRFEYAACRRQDLANSRALTAIVVKEGQTDRRFEMQYGYFGANPTATLCSLPPAATTYQYSQGSYRLKLTAVQEVGKPAYRVNYLTNSLPHRLEASEDHWGFINGGQGENFPIDLANGFTSGRSKEPDSTEMVQGMIKELIYPTGGRTRFIFEPNGYRLPQDSIPSYVPKTVSVNDADRDDATTNYHLSIPFTIKQNGFNPSSVRVKYATPECGIATPQYAIRIYKDGNRVASYCGKTPQDGQSGDVGGGPAVGYGAGNYVLEIDKYGLVGESYFSISWSELGMVASSKSRRVCTGGLRVREIQDFDALHAQPALQKRYYYSPLADTTASSGVTLGTVPVYTSTVRETARANREFPDLITAECDFLMQTTNSQLPLSTIKGNNMAYTSVLVLSDKQGLQGLSQHVFSFAPDYQPYAGYPFTQPTSHEWERGLPLEETDFVYNTTKRFFSPVRRVRTHYTSHITQPERLIDDSTSYTLATQPNETHALGLNFLLATPELYFPLAWENPEYYVPATFHIQAYKLLSVWNYADSKDEFLFDPADSTKFRHTRTTYTYANPKHAQLTATATSVSSFETLTSRFSYPLDFDTTVVASPAATAIRYLARTHQLTPVIESQNLSRRNNQDFVIGGQLVDYEGQWPRRVRELQTSAPLLANTVLPARIQQGKVVAADQYRDLIWLNRYDAGGRLLEYQRNRDGAASILYNRITGEQTAKIKNASYQQVASTSFEPGATGRWHYDSTSTHLSQAASHTGRYAYRLDSQGPVSRDYLPAGDYTLSFWLQGAVVPTLQISTGTLLGPGLQPDATTTGGWTHYTTTLRLTALGRVLLSGESGMLDELRLHPVGAQLTTYTYEPLLGLTSQTDAAGRTIRYEYDALGRLLRSRDESGNIIAQQEYHYGRP